MTDTTLKTNVVATKTKAAVDNDNEKKSTSKTNKPKSTEKVMNINYNQPGRLVNKAKLTLNTYDAQRVFLGFYKSKGIGLVSFAGRMAMVWNAAAKDDPYADWVLLRVYDSIKKCRNQLTALAKKYEKQFAEIHSQVNLAIAPFESSKPLIQELSFTTPYGYIGASLIADFDSLMRIVLTAYKVGILFNQSHTDIYDEWVDKIYNVFRLPYKWSNKTLTRQDVIDKTDKSKTMSKTLGKIPQGVVNKTLRSPFSPYIREKKRVKVAIKTKQPDVDT